MSDLWWVLAYLGVAVLTSLIVAIMDDGGSDNPMINGVVSLAWPITLFCLFIIAFVGFMGQIGIWIWGKRRGV